MAFFNFWKGEKSTASHNVSCQPNILWCDVSDERNCKGQGLLAFCNLVPKYFFTIRFKFQIILARIGNNGHFWCVKLLNFNASSGHSNIKLICSICSINIDLPEFSNFGEIRFLMMRCAKWAAVRCIAGRDREHLTEWVITRESPHDAKRNKSYEWDASLT